MISHHDHPSAGDASWVLKPTRSMTWPQAKRFVAAVAVASFGIGFFFLMRGLPLVLPFSGLEVVAVLVAFWVVLREGEKTEVVTVSDDSLIIERGRREIESRIELNRFWVTVDLQSSRYRYHPSKLLIVSKGETVELGRFLTDAERESFARALINALGKNR